MKRLFCRQAWLPLWIALLLSTPPVSGVASGGGDEIFPVVATVGTNSIAFSWDATPTTTGEISRRPLGGSRWPAPLATIAVDQTSFTDTTLVPGVAYEYRFLHSGLYAYVASGIDLPLVEDRGKVILVVDQSIADACAGELGVLTRDLVGDGWQVIRHDVPRDNGDPTDGSDVAAVKNLILADHNADPANVKAVLLFGRVPIPYSGWHIPDGHFLRALPADGYYGELEGTWTDTRDRGTNVRPRWRNRPGDGKFDQNTWPSDVDLMVGRIDLSDMPAFNGSEVDLLKRYVAKAHAWRHGHVSTDAKAVIGENINANWGPWNFVRQLGLTPTVRNELDALSADRNLFAFFGNTGDYTSVNGIQSTDLAAANINAVFTLEGGSYSVDWDYPDAFMRAFIASSGTALTCGWSEYPGYYLHHLGLGEPIGFSIRTMQNAEREDYKEIFQSGERATFHTMQGDPTIRLHPVAPPTDVRAVAAGGGVHLSWNASPDPEVSGYHVYRAATTAGPFARLHPSAVPGLSFTDPTTRPGDVVYLIRALKLQRGTGTYENASQGVFATFRADGSTNTRPTATPGYGLVDKDAPKPLALAGADGDGEPLTYLVTKHPEHGLIESAGQSLAYRPFVGFVGRDEFSFLVADPSGGVSEPRSMELSVQGGPTDPIAGVRIEAEGFNATNSSTIVTASSAAASFGAKVSGTRNGDWIRFDSRFFDTGVTTLDLSISSAGVGATVEVRLDAPDGTLVGEVRVDPSDSSGWDDFQTISVWLDSIPTGTRDLFLVVKGGAGRLVDLDWLQFNAEGLSFAETIEAESFDSESSTTTGTDGGVTFVDFQTQSGHLQWNVVDGGDGGVTPITFHFANNSGSAREMTLAFRSPRENIGKFDFADTGDLATYQTKTIDVNLRPGLNEIRMFPGNASPTMPWLRLDKLVVGRDRTPSATDPTQGEKFASAFGATVAAGGSGQVARLTGDGSFARYERYNFGANAERIVVTLAGGIAGQTVELRLDDPTGELIGSRTLNPTGASGAFSTLDFVLTRSPDRIHDLYLVIAGGAPARWTSISFPSWRARAVPRLTPGRTIPRPVRPLSCSMGNFPSFSPETSRRRTRRGTPRSRST